MSYSHRQQVLTGCCGSLCFVDEKGNRITLGGYNLYQLDRGGNPALIGHIVETVDGMPVDTAGLTHVPCTVERYACGQRMPDGWWWLTDESDEFNTSGCTIDYRLDSFVVNGTEKVTGTTPTFGLNSGNINYVTVGANQTYTNMVDWLNTWVAANCPDYEFVIPNLVDDANYGAFGILSPIGDTFSIRITKSVCNSTGTQSYEWRQDGTALWDGADAGYNGFKCATEQQWYDEGFLS